MAKHYIEPGFSIHCDSNDGAGYTLCGVALEGVTGGDPMLETPASINCDRCIAIIDFCRKVRPGEVCSPFQRRSHW